MTPSSPDTALPYRAQLEDVLREWAFWDDLADSYRNQLLDELCTMHTPAQRQSNAAPANRATAERQPPIVGDDRESMEARPVKVSSPEAGSPPIAQALPDAQTMLELADRLEKIELRLLHGDQHDRDEANEIGRAVHFLRAAAVPQTPSRQFIIDLIHNEYDPAPTDWRLSEVDGWDDGTGRIADAILATLVSPSSEGCICGVPGCRRYPPPQCSEEMGDGK